MVEKEMRVARRRFLVMSAGAVGVLAACGTTTPPASAPATTAPAAPAASAPPAAAPSPAAAASPAAAPSVAASAPPAAAKPAAGVEQIKIGATPVIANAGIYIGIDRGYFQAQNVDVEIVPFAGAADMVSSLATGQIDAGNADAGAGVWNAIGRGALLKFVADGNHAEAGHSGNAWVIRKDLIDSGAFKSLADLKGKTVSPVGKGSLIDSQFHRSIAMDGLKDTDMNVQYIGFADCLPALANKALDAAILTEPFVANAVDQGIGVRWKGMDEILGPNQSTMIMFSQQFAAQRKDAGNRFMVGYIRGVRDYIDAFFNNKDYDAVVSILTKHTTLTDPALYRKIVVPAFNPNGAMLIDDIVTLEKWYADNGYITTPVDARSPFDTSYIDSAVQVLGKR